MPCGTAPVTRSRRLRRCRLARCWTLPAPISRLDSSSRMARVCRQRRSTIFTPSWGILSPSLMAALLVILVYLIFAVAWLLAWIPFRLSEEDHSLIVLLLQAAILIAVLLAIREAFRIMF